MSKYKYKAAIEAINAEEIEFNHGYKLLSEIKRRHELIKNH